MKKTNICIFYNLLTLIFCGFLLTNCADSSMSNAMKPHEKGNEKKDEKKEKFPTDSGINDDFSYYFNNDDQPEEEVEEGGRNR